MLDILFWNHLYGESLDSLPRRRPKGDSGGMLDECDELPLNIPLTFAWEARAWAACGVLCRPMFDCSSGQQIKIHSFSKNKETGKIRKQKLSEIFLSTIDAVQYTARVKWSKSTLRYLWLTQFQACPSSPQHLSFFWEKLQMPHDGAGCSWKSHGGGLKIGCKCPTPGQHQNFIFQ